MSRYIDAGKVKEYILSTGVYCDTEADRKYSAELIDELFPTADVVEVVRCGECKYRKLCEEVTFEYKGKKGYCSRGEKE